MDLRIPETVTTWVMQAVAINNKNRTGSSQTTQDCCKAQLFYFSEDSVFSKKGRTSISAGDSL